ncbi:recombination protein NinG [Xenorhabdus sp. Vera]|uniref:recombination protein NinG n=1 Tax=Xenorhabdus koppenhoeferi TaxID=351659 RepID=UPI001999E289|nr:recombination protein NinG [Xenorhabdus sp. Vera]MBD2811897.1 recombination protein NinG [Xenorhabdus sp. Vera]
MKRFRKRKCKECGEQYEPERQLQNTCSIQCAITKGKKLEQKKREELERRRKKDNEIKQKLARDKLKARKLAVKPRSYWIQQAQQAVNAYIRERDCDLPCVSCGTFISAQWDAGHYRTTAAAPQLRFDEGNIHKQCIVCNQHKSGNLVPYRVELIRRMGLEQVEIIESNHDRHRWTIEECKAIKAEYREKLRELKREAA